MLGLAIPGYLHFQVALKTRIMYLTGLIYNEPVHRVTFEGILYRLRTGIL